MVWGTVLGPVLFDIFITDVEKESEKGMSDFVCGNNFLRAVNPESS